MVITTAKKGLAVIFPGIGYHADKPLLYYSRRLAEKQGYEIKIMAYQGFPKKVRGDRDKMRKAFRLSLSQAEEFLADTDLTAYEDVLFIGKSIGTAAAAALAARSPAAERIRFVIYTPLEETFLYPLGEAIVFTGAADPWVGGEASRVPVLCRERGIPCSVIRDANHSLETADPRTDIQNLQEIMRLTANFISGEQVRRISHYETLLERLQELLSDPVLSEKKQPAVRETADRLAKYLESTEWKQDYADDEAGLLPKNLKRGVLSQDGIYNALEATRDRESV